MKTITLNENAHIPVLGFGTWELTGATCQEAVREALAVGYRHIDTADAYGNHDDVAKGITGSGVPREELFLTTKIWNDYHQHDDVKASGQRFLEELETDYIDLLLIHWPMSSVPVAETLRAMNELKDEGKVRAIGVSNFTEHHIEEALQSGVEITNNQVEAHPLFNQRKLRESCAEKNISVTAYSPLARGAATKLEPIVRLSAKYNVSPAQVVLNWATSRKMIAIPKSKTPKRIKENLESVSFEMEESDLARIDEIDQGPRLVDPSFSEFDY